MSSTVSLTQQILANFVSEMSQQLCHRLLELVVGFIILQSICQPTCYFTSHSAQTQHVTEGTNEKRY